MRAISTSWMRSGTAIASSPRASTIRPFSRRSVPSSSSDFVTSSRKSGLPSALLATSRCTASGTSAPPSTPHASAAVSACERGSTVTRSVIAAIAEGVAVAGAVRADEQDARAGDRLREKAEALLRLRVDPVQILDHEHERLLRGRREREGLERPERLAAPRRGVEREHARRRPAAARAARAGAAASSRSPRRARSRRCRSSGSRSPRRRDPRWRRSAGARRRSGGRPCACRRKRSGLRRTTCGSAPRRRRNS